MKEVATLKEAWSHNLNGKAAKSCSHLGSHAPLTTRQGEWALNARRTDPNLNSLGQDSLIGPNYDGVRELVVKRLLVLVPRDPQEVNEVGK